MIFRLTPLLLMLLCGFTCAAQSPDRLEDAYPDKAKYAPSDPVQIVVETTGTASGKIRGTAFQLGKPVGTCQPVQIMAKHQLMMCNLPKKDFQGYLIDVELLDTAGNVVDRRATAVDVSSDWKRFPRYGYLAHYNAAEGTDAKTWIEELNKFHINGLEFYDFQYRHEQPLAGTVDHPAKEWKDIAGRPISGQIVQDLIAEAHTHNMMAMAYNASYSAYDDVFTRTENRLPLGWATWRSPNGPRTAATAKKFELHADHWSTNGLYFMNQNSRGWQDYLYGQMAKLFKVYPFDGWHIDTFGEKGAWAFDRSYVDYVHGFPNFINRAHEALHRPIVFNAVNTEGQVGIANSDAEFVYSELWDDHETFSSLLTTADEVHLANPRQGVVFAAYVHRLDTKEREARQAAHFNPPAVLLTDASLFAAGASHIELGDGDRMLSSEYFPADTQVTLTEDLRKSLRSYYDFLTAYENYLRDEAMPSSVSVSVEGQQTSADGVPNTIWNIARTNGKVTTVHLINLLGSEDPHWRDKKIDRPEPPHLSQLVIRLGGIRNVNAVGWASPDVDNGRYHSLPLRHEGDSLVVTVPSLRYWDALFLY